MKTPKKPRPVFFGGIAPTPHKVISASKDTEGFAQGMKNLVADLAPAGVSARIHANLQQIQRDAESILSAKGINDPRFVTVSTATPGKVTAKEKRVAERFRAKGSTVAFDWQVDEQAKFASKAHAIANLAVHHLTSSDFLRTADCALIAATEWRKAIALPFVTSTQASRRRRHETASTDLKRIFFQRFETHGSSRGFSS